MQPVAELAGAAEQLPVEIPLGQEFVFHSIFACPVSRDQVGWAAQDRFLYTLCVLNCTPCLPAPCRATRWAGFEQGFRLGCRRSLSLYVVRA